MKGWRHLCWAYWNHGDDWRGLGAGLRIGNLYLMFRLNAVSHSGYLLPSEKWGSNTRVVKLGRLVLKALWSKP